MRFIDSPFGFFVMSEFNFSLFGAIFGFLLVSFILVRLEKGRLSRYIDGIVLSFFLILTIGYIGAFLGGQVYGRETSFPIDILYSHPFTPVPYQVPIFPLPIVYALISFILFFALNTLSLFVHIRGFIGYIGIIFFSSMILIFETFSGKQDILSVNSFLNLPQVYALILGAFGAYKLYEIFKKEGSKETFQYN